MVRPRRRLRPDLLRPARRAQTARRRARNCRAIPWPTPPTSRRWPAASWSTVARYLGQAGDYRARPALPAAARAHGDGAGRDRAAGAARRRAQAARRGAHHRAARRRERRHPVRCRLPRRRPRRHRLDRARAGARPHAPGKLLQRRRRLLLGRARPDAAPARHGARRRRARRRALRPGQAHARSRLQRAAGQPVSRRDAAAFGGSYELARPPTMPAPTASRAGSRRSAIRAPARSTWSTGSR